MIIINFTKVTKAILYAKKKEKGLLNKSDIYSPVKNSDLNTKLATLATKTKLKAEQDKIVKLQAFDSTYFRNKSHFEDDVT